MAMSLLTLGGSLTSSRVAALLNMLALGLGLSACVPSHNWREIAVENGGVVAMFPSKPDRLTRPIDLNGAKLNMTMVGSKIDRAAFTVAWVDLPSAALAQQARENMRVGMLKNMGYADASIAPNTDSGVRTHPVQVRFRGSNGAHPATLVETAAVITAPMGQNGTAGPAIRPAMRALFVARGLRAWQVVAVGPSLDLEHAKVFTDSFQLLAD